MLMLNLFLNFGTIFCNTFTIEIINSFHKNKDFRLIIANRAKYLVTFVSSNPGCLPMGVHISTPVTSGDLFTLE